MSRPSPYKLKHLYSAHWKPPLAGEGGVSSSSRAPRGRHDPNFGRRLARDPGSGSHIPAPRSHRLGEPRERDAPGLSPAASAPRPARDARCWVTSWRNHGKHCLAHGCRSSPGDSASRWALEGMDAGKGSSQPTWGRGSSSFSLREKRGCSSLQCASVLAQSMMGPFISLLTATAIPQFQYRKMVLKRHEKSGTGLSAHLHGQ